MGTVGWAMMGVAAWGMSGAAIGAVIGDLLGSVIGDMLRAEMRGAMGAVARVAIDCVMLGQHCHAAWVQAQQARKISFSCALHNQNMLTVPCAVCKHMCLVQSASACALQLSHVEPCWVQTMKTI